MSLKIEFDRDALRPLVQLAVAVPVIDDTTTAACCLWSPGQEVIR